MPKKALKVCAHNGCPNLTSGRFCEEHARLNSRESSRKYDQLRPSSSERGYGSDWRRIRDTFIAAHPFCCDPFGIHKQKGEVAPSFAVDHILPRAQGGSDDWTNLQPLCQKCHARKTSLMDGGWGHEESHF